jgi:hypothetical protein
MMILQHKFVRDIPTIIENGILYISFEHNIAIHKCICGCNNEVVTPISPDGWKLTYNGKSVSLYPSIGNWGYECRSHYWITNNEIIQAKNGSKQKKESIKEDSGWINPLLEKFKFRFFNYLTFIFRI